MFYRIEARARRRSLAFRLWGIVVAALALSGSLPAHAQDIFRDKFISLGTSSSSGVYHVVGTSLCEAVNQERASSLIRCVAYNTVGSEYNAKAVSYGELAMGITLPDIAHAEFHQKKAGEHGADLRAVMSLHSKPVVMIVRRAANIADVTQLAGHSINLGNRGSGQRYVVDIIMKALGLTPASFSSTTELHTVEMGKAFCEGKVDIIVESLGNWSPFYKKMIEECQGKILTFPPKMIDRMLAEYPLMSRLAIPAGLYAGYADPVPTFGYRALLVTSVNVSEEAVRRFVASVMRGLPDLKQADPELRDLDADKMFREGISIPLHAGVVSYLNNRTSVTINDKSNLR